MKEALLPTPAENDPNRQRLRVFLLGTPSYLDLAISKQNKVEDIIKHIITTCLMSGTLAQDLQIDKTDSSAYDLRLLDDDEEGGYTPLYEIAALDKRKRIGEFQVEAVSLCKAKQGKVVIEKTSMRM